MYILYRGCVLRDIWVKGHDEYTMVRFSTLRVDLYSILDLVCTWEIYK